MIVRRVLTDPGHSDPECLADRKWWCFLLSSILSFIVGVFSVLFIRACAAVCCRKVVDYSPPEQKKQVEEEKRSEGGQQGETSCPAPRTGRENSSPARLGQAGSW